MLAGERPSAPQILDQITRELYIPGLRTCLAAFAGFYTDRGGKKQGKTPFPFGRDCANERATMRLSTKGRYAVMAMADLAGNTADGA